MHNRFRSLVQMPKHPSGSWEKYCLYHKEVIEALRERAINDAERKAASKEGEATTGMEADGTTSSTTQQTSTRQAAPQRATSQRSTPQQAVSRQSAISLTKPGPVVKTEYLDEVVVKTECLDDVVDDFIFAVDVVSKWDMKKEGHAALWNRMEATVGARFSLYPLFFCANARPQRSCTTAPTWEAFCENHKARLMEHLTKLAERS